MKTKVRPSIVGAFVLGAFGLGLIAVLSFSSIRFLHKQQRFVVFFDESIQGITLGSAVKMSGVTLGDVVGTHIVYNPATNHSAVEVTCELNENKIVDPAGKTVDINDADQLNRLVVRGLRAQITATSFATGLAVVELGFFDPRSYPGNQAVRDPGHPDYPVVPAVLSTISEFQSSAMEILTNIKRIDFQKLAGNVQALADDMRALVNDARSKLDQVDLAALQKQWTQAGAAVTSLATDPQIRRTFDSLDRTLADTRIAIGRLNHQVDTNGDRLATTLQQAQVTLKQFDSAALTLQRFIASQSGLGDSATQALNELSAAADSVQRLADFIDRNPSALLSGRKPPP